MVFEIIKIVTFSLFWVCVHPSCVEVIEIVIWVYGYPSCEEVIVVEVWLGALFLLCIGDCCFDFVPCLLCRGGCVGERIYVLLTLYLQISQWRFPVWEVLCGHSENSSV